MTCFFSQSQPLLVILAGSVLHESPIFNIPIDLSTCFWYLWIYDGKGIPEAVLGLNFKHQNGWTQVHKLATPLPWSLAASCFPNSGRSLWSERPTGPRTISARCRYSIGASQVRASAVGYICYIDDFKSVIWKQSMKRALGMIQILLLLLANSYCYYYPPKVFRYLKWRYWPNLIKLFWGWVSLT